MTNQQIRELLDQNSGKNVPVNLKAWEFFLKEAEDGKLWAASVTDAWKENASEYSKDMQKRYLVTAVEWLAAQFYVSSYWRATTMGTVYGSSVHVDPQAADRWRNEFGENIP